MEDTSWLKQAPDKPLFPDLMWSRPENKRQAGKLLIIGGNSHGFTAPVAAYNASVTAGVGSARVILPQSLKKTLGTSFTEAEFAPSNPSGSFSKQALSSLLDNAKWADGVLLAGDFGRNSETAVLLGSFTEKYGGQTTITQDALDYFLGPSSRLLSRKNTLSVIDLGKLQKLVKNNGSTVAIRHGMSLHELITFLNQWLTSDKFLITKHENHFLTAANGQVSTTKDVKDDNWQVELAAYASVWWLQNPSKPFEALTTAVYSYLDSSKSL